MGHELQSVCQVETRRLLWLTGTMFAVIVIFQYVELPYDNVLSSVFSAGKVPVAENSSSVAAGPSSKSEMVSDVTHLNGLNSTGTSSIHEVVSNTTTSEGEDIDLNYDLESERNNEGQDPDEESSTEKLDNLNKNSTLEIVQNAGNGPMPEKVTESEQSFTQINDTLGGDSSEFSKRENITSIAGHIEPSGSNINMSLVEKDATLTSHTNEKSEQLQSNITTLGKNSSETDVPAKKKKPEVPTSAVISISEMKDMLLKSRASYRSMRPRWSSAVDRELQYAREQIENAPMLKNDNELYSPLYRNVSMFRRSYELMEEKLKVYIYKEGQKPIFHQPVLKGIYASEGWFMKSLGANKKFVTKDPRKAHLFYLPFSSRMLEETLYVPNSHSHKNLIQHLKNYLDMIATKHPFWNRTDGADHFLAACHDWAPSETRQYMAKCIRALCNADVKEGFVFGKDVSLPETYVRSPQNPLREVGGKPPSKRSILAFFAGGMHGYLRPILLQHWGNNRDPDMKIFGRMPRVKGKMSYVQHMKSSKYCICAKGYEVNSPRVVEAIFYECVPVIISDNFIPPFFEVLDWESFAVFVLEKDIPNLKNILLSIPEKKFRQMQMRVKKVQQHFLWHGRPVKYDVFHMILHSIWYNRVFLARTS